MENAEVIVEDTVRDVALLRVKTPHSTASVALHTRVVPSGTPSGSLGFPLGQVVFGPTGKIFNLNERFQGAYVSAYHGGPHPTGRTIYFYETDSLMYGGSSGCPGFLNDGSVFAMHISSIIEGTPAAVTNPSPAANQAAQPQPTTRLAIALWVPSGDIAEFCRANKIKVT